MLVRPVVSNVASLVFLLEIPTPFSFIEQSRRAALETISGLSSRLRFRRYRIRISATLTVDPVTAPAGDTVRVDDRTTRARADLRIAR